MHWISRASGVYHLDVVRSKPRSRPNPQKNIKKYNISKHIKTTNKKCTEYIGIATSNFSFATKGISSWGGEHQSCFKTWISDKAWVEVARWTLCSRRKRENKRPNGPNASLRGQLLPTYSGWGPEKSIFCTCSLRFTMLTGQQRQETRDVMRCGMISKFSWGCLGTNPHQPTQDLTDAARHLCHCGCESAAPFPLKYAYLGHQKNCGAEFISFQQAVPATPLGSGKRGLGAAPWFQGGLNPTMRTMRKMRKGKTKWNNRNKKWKSASQGLLFYLHRIIA